MAAREGAQPTRSVPYPGRFGDAHTSHYIPDRADQRTVATPGLRSAPPETAGQAVRDEKETGSSSYVGQANLEVMDDAVNYNASLASIVVANLRPDCVAVDFGAGTGAIAGLVATRGHNVTCVEPDDFLRLYLVGRGFDCRSVLDAIDADSVDLIYSLNVLEHIEDDSSVVQLFYSRLRPGGKVLIYVPAFPILFSSMDRKVGHHRRYRRRDIVGLLSRAGFVVDQCGYSDCLGFIATLAFKVFGSRAGTLSRRAVVLYDRVIFPLSRRLDGVFRSIGGKNLFAIATRPVAP
jgi:SAM-dependent methyltransferase